MVESGEEFWKMNLRIPKHYQSIELDRDEFGSAIQDLGDTSLEILLFQSDREQKLVLARNALQILISLQYHLSSRPEYVMEVREMENLTNEMSENFGAILTVGASELYGRWKSDDEREFRSFISPIVSVLIDETKQIIHGDYYPANLMIKDKEMYVIDFDHVCLGPWQFDFVNLLKHPSFNLNKDNVEDLFAYFVLQRINFSLKEEHGVKRGKVGSFEVLDSNYRRTAIKTLYFSNIFNDFRILGSSFRSRIKNPLEYAARIQENPRYQGYDQWYLNDLKQVLDDIAEADFLIRDERNSIERLKIICQKYDFF